MKIWNFTQHNATPEQVAAGVVEPDNQMKEQIRELLTFYERPDRNTIRRRAQDLADLAKSVGAERVMIGCALFLVTDLVKALHERGITPLIAYSRRESVEVEQEDGSVRKMTVFRHEGFVEQ